MDLTMVDLTDVPRGRHSATKSCLFGDQGDARLSLDDVARGSDNVALRSDVHDRQARESDLCERQGVR
jgi:hypothetical protein